MASCWRAAFPLLLLLRSSLAVAPFTYTAADGTKKSMSSQDAAKRLEEQDRLSHDSEGRPTRVSEGSMASMDEVAAKNPQLAHFISVGQFAHLQLKASAGVAMGRLAGLNASATPHPEEEASLALDPLERDGSRWVMSLVLSVREDKAEGGEENTQQPVEGGSEGGEGGQEDRDGHVPGESKEGQESGKRKTTTTTTTTTEPKGKKAKKKKKKAKKKEEEEKEKKKQAVLRKYEVVVRYDRSRFAHPHAWLEAAWRLDARDGATRLAELPCPLPPPPPPPPGPLFALPLPLASFPGLGAAFAALRSVRSALLRSSRSLGSESGLGGSGAVGVGVALLCVAVVLAWGRTRDEEEDDDEGEEEEEEVEEKKEAKEKEPIKREKGGPGSGGGGAKEGGRGEPEETTRREGRRAS